MRILLSLIAVLAITTSISAQEKSPILSKFRVDLYGYVKLDAAYDSHRTSNGNVARYAISRSLTDGSDPEFNMTANQTRFGLNITAPDTDRWQASGKIEVDFFGGGGSQNFPNLRMRHAYVQLQDKQMNLTWLFGQTWDVHSPLSPTLVNFNLYNAGNIQSRRAQVRVTKKGGDDGGMRWIAAAALLRNIGSTASAFGPGDSGEDAGLPLFEARVGVTLPLVSDMDATFGFGVHYGEEEFDTSTTADESFKTYSIALDANVPISERLLFRAELFTGQNLASFAGVGGGVSGNGLGGGGVTAASDEIGQTGGWAQLSYKASDQSSINAGFGIDDPENDDLVAGDITRNRAIYGNFLYDLTSAVTMGVELSHWKTDYRGAKGGDAVRLQFATLFKF